MNVGQRFREMREERATAQDEKFEERKRVRATNEHLLSDLLDGTAAVRERVEQAARLISGESEEIAPELHTKLNHRGLCQSWEGQAAFLLEEGLRCTSGRFIGDGAGTTSSDQYFGPRMGGLVESRQHGLVRLSEVEEYFGIAQ
jgi:hypothetical protein